MMGDNRQTNKALVTKINKAQTRIICPVCNRDLTKALKLLNSDFSFHADSHSRSDENNIFDYLSEHIEELPEALQRLLIKRESNFRKLYKYQEELSKRG
jgi:hypothetical protein